MLLRFYLRPSITQRVGDMEANVIRAASLLLYIDRDALKLAYQFIVINIPTTHHDLKCLNVSRNYLKLTVQRNPNA